MENSHYESEQEDFIDVETINDAPFQNEGFIFTEQETHSDEEMIDVLNDPANKPPEIDYDSIGEFCFESEQLALKGNNDYKNVLQASVVLEAQIAQTVKDIEQLRKMKDEALSNPDEFLDRLRRKEKMNFPTPLRVHPLPIVDWQKYAVNEDPVLFARRQMRQVKQMVHNNAQNKARAKLVNGIKNATINFPWTDEEQKKLKKLLVEFPPEEFESNRWEKVANGLGTRTSFEIAARVHQCYTILAKDNTIVLGRIPDLASLITHWYPETDVEKQEDSTELQTDDFTKEELSPELHNSAEYQELIFLKKLLKKREKEEAISLVPHIGYRCVYYFCEDCSRSMYETDVHSRDHRLEKVYGSIEAWDMDHFGETK
ncbi:ZZ-type zinc finger-containing protein 3 [Caerostris extrusa]|uniref:ZZ-type zinc finger-containing protein 3 n=1 Tax=Caerostris extrusa TaxID=172846 RepID=A0AAV4XKU3_CAEEX|nr:ZZ-type zinc finger-containing protein 3 [Caerostris extrusa]